jgi:hypothetical protein
VWQYALWGLVGAAVNRALVYLEETNRAKGWPWQFPYGPGAGPYLVSVVLHCGIAAGVTAGAAAAGYIGNAVVALGIGAAAPVVVKKISGYTLALLPRAEGEAKGQDNAP